MSIGGETGLRAGGSRPRRKGGRRGGPALSDVAWPTGAADGGAGYGPSGSGSPASPATCRRHARRSAARRGCRRCPTEDRDRDHARSLPRRCGGRGSRTRSSGSARPADRPDRPHGRRPAELPALGAAGRSTAPWSRCRSQRVHREDLRVRAGCGVPPVPDALEPAGGDQLLKSARTQPVDEFGPAPYSCAHTLSTVATRVVVVPLIHSRVRVAPAGFGCPQVGQRQAVPVWPPSSQSPPNASPPTP